MFLFDIQDVFPIGTDFGLVPKDDKCCTYKHYKAIPYKDFGDISMFVTSANTLTLLGVSLVMYETVGIPYVIVPLTAGVEFDYRIGTDPDGRWQLQISPTVGLNTWLNPIDCKLFGFIVTYTDDANVMLSISYEYAPTECFCSNWVRICDNKNQWGCTTNYLSVKYRPYYGDLDNLTTSTGGYSPNHCVVIPSRINENSAKNTVDLFESFSASKERKIYRYEIVEMIIPRVRMKQIEEVLSTFVTLDSNVSGVDNLDVKITTAQNFTDIGSQKECLYNMKMQIETVPCERSPCLTSISQIGCRFNITKDCDTFSFDGITDGMTPAELTSWNSVNKNLTWVRSGSQFKGILRIRMTSGSTARRNFCLNWISVKLASWKRLIKIGCAINGGVPNLAFWKTQLNNTTITSPNYIDLVISSENPNGNPIDEIQDCDNVIVPLQPYVFLVDYPTAVFADFSNQNLLTTFYNENRNVTLRAIAPIGCTPQNISIDGDNWYLKDKKTGVIYNNVVGLNLSVLNIVISGGGLNLTLPLGADSFWATYDIWFLDGFMQSNIQTVTQTIVF